MKPVNFSESTKVLQRPETMPKEDCMSLPVWNDGEQCVSCWKPSFKERIKILFGGKVWLGVLSGKTQPPVFVTADRVFPKTPFKERVRLLLDAIKECVVSSCKKFIEAAKEPDKRLHFCAGLLISLVTGSLLGEWIGFGIGFLAGLLKEFWDSKGHGTVEKMDVVFTTLGALVAVPLSLLIYYALWIW